MATKTPPSKYEYTPYPKYIYSPSGAAVLVQDAKDQAKYKGYTEAPKSEQKSLDIEKPESK